MDLFDHEQEHSTSKTLEMVSILNSYEKQVFQ